jgi:hypothetical protein
VKIALILIPHRKAEGIRNTSSAPFVYEFVKVSTRRMGLAMRRNQSAAWAKKLAAEAAVSSGSMAV